MILTTDTDRGARDRVKTDRAGLFEACSRLPGLHVRAAAPARPARAAARCARCGALYAAVGDTEVAALVTTIWPGHRDHCHDPDVKQCRGCRAWLPVGRFHRDRYRRDGRSAICATCRRDRDAARRRAAAHPAAAPLPRVPRYLLDRVPPASGWRGRQACGPDDALTFLDVDDQAAAVALCRACPVTRSCLESALDAHPDPHQQVGYLGGQSAEQRADILTARAGRRAAAADVAEAS